MPQSQIRGVTQPRSDAKGPTLTTFSEPTSKPSVTRGPASVDNDGSSKKSKNKKVVVPATEIVKGMGTRRISTPAEEVKVEEPRGPHNQGLSVTSSDKSPELQKAENRFPKTQSPLKSGKKAKEPTALEVVKGMGLNADMKLSPKSDDSTSPVEELSKIPTLELLANSASELLGTESQAKPKPVLTSILKKPKSDESRDVDPESDQLFVESYDTSFPLASPKVPRSGEILANAFEALNVDNNQQKPVSLSPGNEPPPPYDFAMQPLEVPQPELTAMFTAKQKRNSSDSRTSPTTSTENVAKKGLPQLSDAGIREGTEPTQEIIGGKTENSLSYVTGGILKKKKSPSPSRKII